jgi:hypothetical protein
VRQPGGANIERFCPWIVVVDEQLGKYGKKAEEFCRYAPLESTINVSPHAMLFTECWIVNHGVLADCACPGVFASLPVVPT